MGAKRLGLGLRVCADRAPEWRHAMTIDLDKLERLEREATPGKWFAEVMRDDAREPTEIFASGPAHEVRGSGTENHPRASGKAAKDARLIAALRNAAPALIAELRSARKRSAELARDARLAQAVREAAEQTGDITDVEVLSGDDL